jgi:hypothetical protein
MSEPQVLFETADLRVTVSDRDRQLGLGQAGTPPQKSQQVAEGREIFQGSGRDGGNHSLDLNPIVCRIVLFGLSWVILAQKGRRRERRNVRVGTSNDRRVCQTQIHPVEETK